MKLEIIYIIHTYCFQKASQQGKSDILGSEYLSVLFFSSSFIFFFFPDFMRKLLLRDDASLDKLMNTVVKETLEIPTAVTWGGQSSGVFSYLYEDFMKPATSVGM
jgi:hypothetical protein